MVDYEVVGSVPFPDLSPGAMVGVHPSACLCWMGRRASEASEGWRVSAGIRRSEVEIEVIIPN